MDSEIIALVSAPLEVPVGGYLREWHVEPHLLQLLCSRGLQPVLILPFTGLLTYAKHLAEKLGEADADMVYARVVEGLERLAREAGCAEIVVPWVDAARIAKLTIRIGEAAARTSGSRLSPQRSLVNLYNLLNEVKNYAGPLDTVLPRRPILVYVKHETLDSLYIGARLSSARLGSALLLQSLDTIHLGRCLYQRPGCSRGALGTALDKLASSLFTALARRMRLSLINSITPEILLAKDLLGRMGYPTVRVLDPPNALPSDIPGKLPGCRPLDEGVKFIYFGRVSVEKGIEDLLKAWGVVERRVENAQLLVIGPFENSLVERRVAAIVRALGLRRVTFTGALPHRRVIEEAMQAHVLLYPSYLDSFSLTVLEAVATGLITVAYNIPAIAYYYRGVPTVVRVKPGDVMSLTRKALELASGYDRICEKMLENNIPVIEEFITKYRSWRRVAEAEAESLLGLLDRAG